MHRSFAKYQKRLILRETNYGRETEWLIKHDDHVLARLMDPRRGDQFWYSYRLEVLTDDEEWQQRLLDETWWKGDGWTQVSFYNPVFEYHADHAFPASHLLEGHISMRGMYVPKTGLMMPWDFLILWWLRRYNGLGSI